MSKLDASAEGSDAVARAIMTTDTVKKEISYAFEVGGKTAHIGGISKGSGMIHPQMGTMLCYLTTDACASAASSAPSPETTPCSCSAEQRPRPGISGMPSIHSSDGKGAILCSRN